MQEQFLDRILNCVDCHGEFIFTAGEQLFFFDKQFKNDPKRCKPCKSRRSGLAAAANGQTGPAAAGLSRTETRTQCSDCGVETTVPFKPTQGRPVLCRQCFQLKNRAAAAVPAPIPVAIPGIPADGFLADGVMSTEGPTATEARILVSASEEVSGAKLSPDAALVAASSIAAASPQSSVSTPEDLAYIASLQPQPPPVRTQAQAAAALLAASPAELLATATTSTPELQPALAGLPQA